MVIFNFKYHLIFSILFFFVIEKYTSINLDAIGLFGCLLAFALPDIDMTNSKAGRKLRPISVIISIFKHRGITHSLFGILIIALLASLTGNYQFIYGMVIGYSSHIIADMSTTNGVMLFWPFPIQIRIPIISRFKFVSGLFWIILLCWLLFYDYSINNLFEQFNNQVKTFKF